MLYHIQVFTMLLGVCDGRWVRIALSCIVSWRAGVAMVTLADSANKQGGHSLLGDMLCLLSSMLYAMYTITIRRMLPDDCHADVAGLFGLIGLLNLVCMAPVLVLLWFTSVVHLQGLTVWLIFLAICKGMLESANMMTNPYAGAPD